MEIVLDASRLPVSYLSSLLRVVQAALREVARSNDDARPIFAQRPQPTLLTSIASSEGELTLRFIFADPMSSRPLPELSSHTFEAFFEKFSRFLKGLPQPGLWGRSIGGASQRRHESELSRRMEQLRVELRRFPWARLSFDGRAILIEGDRMEIE